MRANAINESVNVIESDRTYNEACADVYDQWFGSCEEAAIDRLAELAGSTQHQHLVQTEVPKKLLEEWLGMLLAPDRQALWRLIRKEG